MIARSDAACFVGVDLHKDTLTACVINAATHEVSYAKIACKCRSRIQEFFSTLPRPSCVAIETVGFYRWFWDELEPIADRLVLADARGARALAGRPGPARMDSGGLHRYLLNSAERIDRDDATILWSYHRRLAELEQDMGESRRRIGELIEEPNFGRVREILESIPGVALITSATAIAEIGDFSRFPDGKAIGRYAGLTPTGYASADKNRLGRICKTGSPDLRWILQQAAWTAVRCDPAIKGMWLKLSKKAGKKAAAVAIARKILVWMWTLVRKDELYKPGGPVAPAVA